MRDDTRLSVSSTARETELQILVPADMVRRRVAELAGEIRRDTDASESLVVMVVLKGAFIFAADLLRELDLSVRIEFITLSSYGDGDTSSGNVKTLSEINSDIKDKDVLVVEDIVDTGHTIRFLMQKLKSLGARRVRVCTLLDKPSRREKAIKVHYTGFIIPNLFVVGYGIDYQGKYRHLRDICYIDRSIAEKRGRADE